MEKKRTSAIGILTYILLITALGYFEYNKTVTGAFGGLLLALIFTLVSLVGLVPLVGILIFLWLSGVAISWWSNFTGLASNTLTVTVAYWLNLIGVILLNVVVTLLIVLYIRNR
jgi:hypothetical protein